MSKYFYRRVIAIFISLIIVLLASTLYFRGSLPGLAIKKLDPQTQIIHEVKYEVRPIYNQRDRVVTVDILTESYQHADHLSRELLDTVLLEDHRGEIYLPTKWVETELSEYRVSGKLVFSELKTGYKGIKLVFFGVEDVVFKWPKEES
ncbi:hypothetical protein DID77_02890 [Candidatus Marinamargulisbacteria bacterium SCGC AG-439-L15]|nr:hypothetical protein DID77_02890 [Candidatus Marinamargulisbacteria bacterium SCGC AG-439-L15]